MRKTIITILVFVLITPIAFAQNSSEDEVAIIAVLNDFHDAAANADVDRYLGNMTADAVFLGTDEWERWPMQPEFIEYVNVRFDAGGWSYYSTNKNISFSQDGNVAWFDESSISNSMGGHFRGSGVLEKINGEWKISHYVLSVLVYNEISNDVMELITVERETRENQGRN
ncbi:MAG: nuclear transport factor 2 family protein [Gammaproteobacteria bacterium]|jgi:ketosteroid isomerase-like protein|nr:nuclear transport factor 2 family protein [Gammaproteobacteria bacterium]